MAEVVLLNDPENYQRVALRIKRLWKDGVVEFTVHAQQRMRQRRFDVTDIDNIIRCGRVTEHSCPRGRWRYTIRGKTVAGNNAEVVVEINGSLVIVSAIRCPAVRR